MGVDELADRRQRKHGCEKIGPTMGVIYRSKPGIVPFQMQRAEIPDATWIIEVGQTHPGLPGSYRDEIVFVDYENRWYRRRGGHPQPFPDRWVRSDDLVWEDYKP